MSLSPTAPSPLRTRLRGTLSPAWGRLLDIVYPPRCGGCDRRGTWLCGQCKAGVLPVPTSLPVPVGLAGLVSAGAFAGPLRSAIHNLKYNSDTPLAKPLAALLWASLGSPAGEWTHDPRPVLAPVPLHKSRQRARGYNQSSLLVDELAHLTGWVRSSNLVRLRDTGSQVGLSAARRLTNVEGAFAWQGNAVPPVVILVDDVCTSGATLSECADAIRAAGGVKIYAATVARALFKDKPDHADR